MIKADAKYVAALFAFVTFLDGFTFVAVIDFPGAPVTTPSQQRYQLAVYLTLNFLTAAVLLAGALLLALLRRSADNKPRGATYTCMMMLCWLFVLGGIGCWIWTLFELGNMYRWLFLVPHLHPAITFVPIFGTVMAILFVVKEAYCR